jgi:hypothetical protein
MSAEAVTPEDPDKVVTPERAAMLAAHAIYVQGGFSTAEVERVRAEADIASGNVPDWARMQAEVQEALLAKAREVVDYRMGGPEPTPVAAAVPPAEPAAEPAVAAPAGSAAAEVDPTEDSTAQRVDVTAVLANIDQGESLRDRIKKLTAELKIHEDIVKDVLGSATAGTDATGKVVVRYPFRNRSGLSKEKVKERLSAEDYAACETVTEYRSMLYGEG